jgi:hypothetical protein
MTVGCKNPSLLLLRRPTATAFARHDHLDTPIASAG